MCIGWAEPAGKTQPPNSQFLGPEVSFGDYFTKSLQVVVQYNDFDLFLYLDPAMDAKCNFKTQVFWFFEPFC
jgi:hypothetical protein